MRWFFLIYIILALLVISYEDQIVRTWKGWFGREEAEDHVTSVWDEVAYVDYDGRTGEYTAYNRFGEVVYEGRQNTRGF